MTDRFDEAKRALDEVPVHDVWSEAQARARTGTVLPLASVADARGRHRGRWLAAAAAVALLAVGAVAVLADDGDPKVESGTATPGSDDPALAEIAVHQADGACKLGISGEPLLDPVAVSPAETFVVDDDGQPVVGTLVEGELNDTQTYAVQVPGQVVTDLVGERVEDVQLQRGTAQIWFQPTAVQVRWFTGSQETCESFTVTVAGGSEDGNRHAAVDLAERVVLPRELLQPEPPPVADNPLAGTEWFLGYSTLRGEPKNAGTALLFTFTDTGASWTDGCNQMGAAYTYVGDTIRLREITTTDMSCEATPTSEAVHEVMRSGEVAVTIDGDELELRGGEGQLVLGQAGRTVEVPPDDETVATQRP